jgi:hypothetical protein
MEHPDPHALAGRLLADAGLEPDPLVHEEHTAHVITVGDFELAAQVEHTPAEIRVVAD